MCHLTILLINLWNFLLCQDFIIYWGNLKENEDTFIGKGKQIIFYVKYINIISYVNFKKYGIFMKNGPGKPGK